jgi:ferredoxin/flavodoxin---NADP+ reductase
MAGAFHDVTVTKVDHYTGTLFAFETTRPTELRFRNGEFVMVGLDVEGKPLTRAYSIASPNHAEHLGFYSIKVPNGPLTSRLQHVKVGDTVLVGKKPVGTLVQDNLTPGKNLYLFATGTGLAPFISVAADPEAYERFEKIVVVHGCREVAELKYGFDTFAAYRNDEWIGEMVRDKLIHVTLATREDHPLMGRIPDIVRSGKLAEVTGLPQLNPQSDRVMLCGSPAMLTDCKAMLEEMGFAEGSAAKPAQFVIERAFVEK